MITLTWQHLDLHCIQIVDITRWFLQNSKMSHSFITLGFFYIFCHSFIKSTNCKMQILNFSIENIYNPATCLGNIIRSIKTRNEILLPKLFWHTVRKSCSSDQEKLLKFEAEGQEFAKFLRSAEQFIQTVKGQNNFW